MNVMIRTSPVDVWKMPNVATYQLTFCANATQDSMVTARFSV